VTNQLLAILCLAVIAFASSCSKEPSLTAVSPTDGGLPEENATLIQWVCALQTVYDQEGLVGFLRAKVYLAAQAKDWSSDEDYRPVALVLLFADKDLKSDELELASRLRFLAQQIERFPGASEEAWDKFSDSLLSYSFGNSPIQRGTTAERLVTLYAKIAGCERRWMEELRKTSEKPETLRLGP
jgi:hypothetical protein